MSGVEIDDERVKYNTFRACDARQIEEAYFNAEEALRRVGKLLLTTEAGSFAWSCEHRSIVTGMRRSVVKLRRSVPDYGQYDKGG